MQHPRRVAYLLVICAAGAGCSWAAMDTLPERPVVGVDYACDASRALPAIDTAVAVIGAAATVATVVAQVECADGSVEPGCSTVTIGYAWAVVGAVYARSAYQGFAAARRCRAYHDGRLPLVPQAAPLPPPPGTGQACERIPGVPRGGRCPHGLVCRGDVCQP